MKQFLISQDATIRIAIAIAAFACVVELPS
jgi:hypothetical protein